MIVKLTNPITEKNIQGTLRYFKSDHGFAFETNEELSPTASLTISHSLELQFDIKDGRLLYVDGYLPLSDETDTRKANPFSIAAHQDST